MRREIVVWLGVMVAVAVAVVVAVPPMAKAETSSRECKEERNRLVGACKAVIFGIKPSANCCARVRETHVECACPYVTPKLANLINVQRSINQIQGCGRTVPRNFKCGSVTTPP